MVFGIGYFIVLVLGCMIIGVFWLFGKLVYLFMVLFICKGYFVVDLIELGFVDLVLFMVVCCFCCLKGKLEIGDVLFMGCSFCLKFRLERGGELFKDGCFFGLNFEIEIGGELFIVGSCFCLKIILEIGEELFIGCFCFGLKIMFEMGEELFIGCFCFCLNLMIVMEGELFMDIFCFCLNFKLVIGEELFMDCCWFCLNFMIGMGDELIFFKLFLFVYIWLEVIVFCCLCCCFFCVGMNGLGLKFVILSFLDIVVVLCMWEEVVKGDIIMDVLFFWLLLKDLILEMFDIEFLDIILDVVKFLLVVGGREWVCWCFGRCIKFEL